MPILYVIGNGTQSFGGGISINNVFTFATFPNPGNGQPLFTVIDALGNVGTLGTAPAFRVIDPNTLSTVAITSAMGNRFHRRPYVGLR